MGLREVLQECPLGSVTLHCQVQWPLLHAPHPLPPAPQVCAAPGPLHGWPLDLAWLPAGLPQHLHARHPLARGLLSHAIHLKSQPLLPQRSAMSTLSNSRQWDALTQATSAATCLLHQDGASVHLAVGPQGPAQRRHPVSVARMNAAVSGPAVWGQSRAPGPQAASTAAQLSSPTPRPGTPSCCPSTVPGTEPPLCTRRLEALLLSHGVRPVKGVPSV